MNNKKTIAQQLKQFTGFTTRMFVIVTAIIVAFLTVIFINIYNLYNVQFVTQNYQMEIRKDVQTINKRLLFAVASNDADVTAAQVEDLEGRFPKIEGYFSTISDNLNNEELGSALVSNWKAFEDTSFEMLGMVQNGDINGALEYYNSTLNDVSETLADSLDETGALAEAAAAGKYQTILIIIIIAGIVLLIVLCITILMSNKQSKAVVKDIEEDLDVLAKASSEIAKGNVHVEIDYDSDNEIGKVANQLKKAVASLQSYIDEIGYQKK